MITLSCIKKIDLIIKYYELKNTQKVDNVELINYSLIDNSTAVL